ncbi:hypothetical protein QBC47DRAFT_388193 [Echria macrotheca]|uniref:DUF7708 domain-containing protein n=1 Tax=Echria macrotheca TaxID=438768 RepID=A0AAJ0B898_9PEZI|nr:hypothetical protein QBC47DRAFT_388193 [Echria macrotheca]
MPLPTGNIVDELRSGGWVIEHPGSVPPPSSAAEAFRAAQDILNNTSTQTGLKTEAVSTIDEVLAAVQDAQREYHMSRGKGKAWKWITRLSSRILFYAEVMDVMSEHHPEYVSLAWGLVKLVFIGVANHETLIKEVSKAFCRICDAVKHVQLKLLLYPTRDMQEQVGTFYAHLVKFAIRAIKWYREPRILHAVTAIARPYSLRFKDIVEDIQDTIRQTDRLALSMSQAEQRQILLKIDEGRSANEVQQQHISQELEATRKELQATHEMNHLMLCELKTAIEGATQLHSIGLINTNRQLSEIQLSQIMSFLSQSPLPSPEAVLRTLSAKRKLRLRPNQTTNAGSSLSRSTVLQSWGASKSSTHILVEAPFGRRHTLRDFAVDVIDLVGEANIPAVWALTDKLSSSANQTESEWTPNDILKSLTSQILKINSQITLADERAASLNARRFQSARTEAEWFSLLGSVMHGLQQVYLVIDLDSVDRISMCKNRQAPCSWLGEFPRFFDRLREQGVETVVKVAFLMAASAATGLCLPNKGGEGDWEASGDVTLAKNVTIKIPRRESGRVGKVGRMKKSARKRRKALVEVLEPVVKGGLSP